MKKSVFLVTTSIMTAVIIGLSAFIFVYVLQVEKDKIQTKNTMDSLNTHIASLEEQIKSKDETINSYDAGTLDDAYTNYKLKKFAIMISSDKKYYHTVYCDKINISDGFTATSEKSAENKGYYACPYCH